MERWEESWRLLCYRERNERYGLKALNVVEVVDMFIGFSNMEFIGNFSENCLVIVMRVGVKLESVEK